MRPDGTFMRKIIIKFFYADDEEDARQEFRILQMLTGSPHVVRLVGGGFQTFGDAFGIMEEYLGYGTLQGLYDRVVARQEAGIVVRIPERFIWNVFFCLVRMCVVLRFPPQGAPQAPLEPETIPNDGVDRPEILHNDIYGSNVLIAGPSNTFDHAHGPLLELIDFGSSEIREADENYDEDDVEDGWILTTEYTEENLYQCAALVMRLAVGKLPINTMGQKVKVLTSGGGQEEVTTEGPVNGVEAAGRSPRLISLLWRCMSDAIPELEEVWDICEDRVLQTSVSEYMNGEYGVYETDEYLRWFIGELVLNADYSQEIWRRTRGQRRSFETAPRRRSRSRITSRKRYRSV
ncbi:hypothetical protein GGR52DRAFT_18880 [Hypoxylon sp. FL1284]|nr:hypothetical protein GGR52DRAFT_18880 [Hypoxylon sp. FL1284]